MEGPECALEVDFQDQSYKIIRKKQPTSQRSKRNSIQSIFGDKDTIQEQQSCLKTLQYYMCIFQQREDSRTKSHQGGIFSSYHVPGEAEDYFSDTMDRLYKDKGSPYCIPQAEEELLFNKDSMYYAKVGIDYVYDVVSRELNITAVFKGTIPSVLKCSIDKVYLQIRVMNGLKTISKQTQSFDIQQTLPKQAWKMAIGSSSLVHLRDMELSIRLFYKTGVILRRSVLIDTWTISLHDFHTFYKRRSWRLIQ